MKRSALLLALLGLLPSLGCHDAAKHDERTDSPAVQAREEAKRRTASPSLNSRLVTKVKFGTAAEVRELLDKGADVGTKDRYGLPAIFVAAQRGEVGVLQELINAGAEVNGRIGGSSGGTHEERSALADGTPLGYAAQKGRLEALALLKQAGADVNGMGLDGTTPLMQAAEGGQLEAIKWLVHNGGKAGRDQTLDRLKSFPQSHPVQLEMIRLLSTVADE